MDMICIYSKLNNESVSSVFLPIKVLNFFPSNILCTSALHWPIKWLPFFSSQNYCIYLVHLYINP